MSRNFVKRNQLTLLAVAAFILAACASPTFAPTATNPPAAVQSTAEREMPADEPTLAPTDKPTAVLDEPTAVPDEPVVVAATAAPVDGNLVSFVSEILPIMQDSCLQCHGGEKTERGFDVSSYAALMAGSRNGAMLIPGDANASKLFTLSESGKMPKRGTKLSADQIQLLRDWINQGALDN